MLSQRGSWLWACYPLVSGAKLFPTQRSKTGGCNSITMWVTIWKKYYSDVIRVTIIWYLLKEAEFQYTLEHKAVKWSPMVSNLHMGHIRVVFVVSWLLICCSFICCSLFVWFVAYVMVTFLCLTCLHVDFYWLQVKDYGHVVDCPTQL